MHSPRNYTAQPFKVYVEVADKTACIEVIKSSYLDFTLEKLEENEFGITLVISNQVIPELIQLLAKDRHAIYQVIRQDLTAIK